MCDPTSLMVMTAASAAMSAVGQYQQGQAAKQVGRNNQIMSEYAAQDALRRGEDEAIAARRQAAQVRGGQRAAMAARGLDLTAGTPAELIDQTDFFGEQDVRTVRGNAARDAWSARTQGAQAAAEGRAAASQGTLGAAGSILGGAAQVADQWYRYKGPPKSYGGAIVKPLPGFGPNMGP